MRRPFSGGLRLRLLQADHVGSVRRQDSSTRGRRARTQLTFQVAKSMRGRTLAGQGPTVKVLRFVTDYKRNALDAVPAARRGGDLRCGRTARADRLRGPGSAWAGRSALGGAGDGAVDPLRARWLGALDAPARLSGHRLRRPHGVGLATAHAGRAASDASGAAAGTWRAQQRAANGAAEDACIRAGSAR